MAEPRTPPPPPPPSALPKPNLTSRFLGLLLLIFVPVLLAAIFFQPPDFDPAPLPSDHSFADSIAVQERHNRVLEASERIGEGLLPGPEDLAYDAEKGYLYTGCSDGWIRRVGLEDGEPKVEDWAYVGGRPLGLALGPSGSLVVAESYKGRTISWDILFKFPFARKMARILEKFVKPSYLLQDSGILSVTLQRQPLTIYSGRRLIFVTCGLNVGKNLYYGSLYASYISKIDFTQYGSDAM
ncbi:protein STRICTOSIDINE SYNTHASE-LIKE 5 [Elaeis guineensis]|uniref:protein STRICTOSIDINE SYNTHASE-LIKE 5 n=1 Tax=Elaeis guineensis var. tenera TaxID=51953 RepID=UPI003C6D41CC